jgi:hypothetical protein
MPNRRGATTTIIVPEGELAGEQWRDTRPANDGGTTPNGERSELRAVLTLVDRLSSQLAEANKRVDTTLALLANANTERAEAQSRAMQAVALIANLQGRSQARRGQG